MKRASDSVWLLLIALCFFISANGFGRVVAESLEEPCEDGLAAVWKDTNDTQWTSADNWSGSKLPNDFSIVVLEAEAVTVLSNNANVRVSGAKIGSQAKLSIAPGAKLTIENREISCYDTKWCSGHGDCVGINECRCDEGWEGDACDVRSASYCSPRDACGNCEDGGIECGCGEDLLGESQDYLSRLLLLETNDALKASIASTQAKLLAIRALGRSYDPYSEQLVADMAAWIGQLQEFCDQHLDAFRIYNSEILTELENTNPLPDPCDETEAQSALEKRLN